MSSHIGRYHRVRALTPWGDLGPSLILDRKKASITPYRKWRMTPTGIFIDQEGAFSGGQSMPHFLIGASGFTTGSQTIVALDSNYVAGTSGDAVMTRLSTEVDRTLTDIYFFITTYTGTAANVNDLNWSVRTGSVTVPTNTAPALIASGTLDPASATSWIRISGLAVPMTAGTFYWVIIGDADGGAVDLANVMQDHGTSLSTVAHNGADCISAVTDDGGQTATLTARAGSIACVFSDGATRGSPFSVGASSNSSTNRRGIYLASGFPFASKVWGLMSANIGNNLSGGELIFDNTVPGGEVLGTTSILTSGTNSINGFMFSTPPVLQVNMPARIVCKYSGVATSPVKISIGTGNDANLKSMMMGSGRWYWGEANGTTDWSNDDTTSFPLIAMIIEDFIPEGRLTSIRSIW